MRTAAYILYIYIYMYICIYICIYIYIYMFVCLCFCIFCGFFLWGFFLGGRGVKVYAVASASKLSRHVLHTFLHVSLLEK